MAIKLDDWKNINKTGEAERAHAERIKSEANQAKLEKELPRNPFLRNMVRDAGRTGAEKVGDKPILPQERQKTPVAERGPEAPKPHETAQQKAERGYQDARGSQKTLDDLVFKRPAPNLPEHVERRAPEGTTKQQVGTSARGDVNQGATKIAQHAVAGIAQQAKPDAGQDAGRTKNQEGKASEARVRQEVVAARKEVESKKGAEGTNADSDTGSGGLKGDAGKQVGSHAGIALGAERSKVEGKKGEGDRRGVEKNKGKKTGGAGRSRPAYAGTVESQSTMGKLGSLVGGSGGEEPSAGDQTEEIKLPTTQYEPIDWDTGIETYTNDPRLAKAEEVYSAYVEHRQRTEKRESSKVVYENWDISDRSIRERFILETEQAVEYARQVIEYARLPKDPRGYGSHC